MTVTDETIEQALQIFEQFLRTKRLKMTEQRRTMIRTALTQEGHFTAEELYRHLDRSGDSVSMATVYRGLGLLEEAGLVAGHDFADGLRRFERAIDREHHDHMICLDCRAVIEFTDHEIERLQEEAAKKEGFTLDDHSLTLFVRCESLRQTKSCERKDAEEQAARPPAS